MRRPVPFAFEHGKAGDAGGQGSHPLGTIAFGANKAVPLGEPCRAESSESSEDPWNLIRFEPA